MLRETPGGMVAESVVVGSSDDGDFALHYRIRCDPSWRLRSAEIGLVGGARKLELTSDGAGNWTDGRGKKIPRLKGAIDIDISATPFTNTLPIQRLKLRAGQSADLVAAYVLAPALSLTTDPQRYTRLKKGQRYRYESLDSDFTREIEVDRHGLVKTYPGLFRRVL